MAPESTREEPGDNAPTGNRKHLGDEPRRRDVIVARQSGPIDVRARYPRKPTLIHEDSAASGWSFDIHHDASAVLLKDGCVVAGVAQERLDRVKLSNAFPIEAVRFCLKEAGYSFDRRVIYRIPERRGSIR